MLCLRGTAGPVLNDVRLAELAGWDLKSTNLIDYSYRLKILVKACTCNDTYKNVFFNTK